MADLHRLGTERPVVSAAILLVALSACVEPPPGGFAGLGLRDTHEARLEIADYTGAPADPLDAPLRPRVRFHARATPLPDPDALYLLRGPLDSALLDDLSKAPLLAANRERALPLAMEARGNALELLPVEPLERGADYTLAVAGWARDAVGEPITSGGEPLLFELRASTSADAGARVLATWPADGAAGLGTDLPSAVVVFDGVVVGAEDGAWLQGPDGTALPADVTTAPCEQLAPPVAGHSCVRIAPRVPLTSLAEHRIVLGRALRDARGAPVGPFHARFRTASGSDRRAPMPVSLACGADEAPVSVGCALIGDGSVRVRLAADEAFVGTAHIAERTFELAGPRGEATLLVDGLSPGEEVAIAIELLDASLNRSEHALSLTTHADLATLSITEVRADPLGDEPAQEAIEVWNFGTEPIALAGMHLGDSAAELGTILESAAVVEPGARVVLVPERFDPQDPSDFPLAPGVTLVRVSGTLGAGGLANRGEPVFLRDQSGRRLSAAPSTPKPLPGVCTTRIASDPRTGEPGSFEHDALGRCTLGY